VTLLVLVSLLLFPTSLFAELGDYSSHEVTDTGLVVIAGSDTLVFSIYASDVMRVDFLPAGAQGLDSTYAVIRGPSAAVDFDVSNRTTRVELRTSGFTLRIDKFPVRLTYYDTRGVELLAEPASGGLEAPGTSRSARFELPPDLHLYGTGERGIGIDLRGYSFSTYNSQVYGYSGPVATMKINIPLLTTSSGYALYFESPIPANMDLGATDPSVFYYGIDGGELSYFFMIGRDVPAQIERYTWLTGRQPLPPKWALGYLQSKYGYRHRADAEDMIQTMRSKGIPADAIILDLYWFWNMGDLEWNNSAFPDPAGMISDFLADGFKTIVITEPYFTYYSDNYPFLMGAGSDYVGQTGSGNPYVLNNWWSCGCDALLFDISNPDAQAWLWAEYEDFMATGVAGLWTDLGEPESHPWDMEHHIGATPRVHNIYNLLWAKTLFEGFASYRPNDRMVNLTRSGYAGIQRYGVLTWSGDVSRSFGGLAVQLPIMLNMSLSGMGYHSSDLGGFTGWASPELYSRWIQFGAFNPVMRPHGVDNQSTEPWGYGSEAEAIARYYISLRYMLLPYIYSLARETYETGMPMVRPLFFHDPGDPLLANHSDAYLFGPYFLVAPVVVDGQREKNVYLPKGIWIHYWTDSLHTGGTTVLTDAPLGQLPVFVRVGAIIPMQQVMDYVGAEPADSLFLDIFPTFSDVPDTFYLYEDDGETLDYKRGEYAMTPLFQRLTYNGMDHALEITVDPARGGFPEMLTSRTVVAAVRRVENAPSLVRLNSDTLDAYPSGPDLFAGGDGYYYDAGANLLRVKFEHDVTLASVITIEGTDLPAGISAADPEAAGILLGKNRPNPFTHGTSIGFTVRRAMRVKIEVFNLLGQRVAVLLDEERQPGRYLVVWDGRDAKGVESPPGGYFYRLSAAGTNLTGKMVLLR
jgi:alpha-glucosidase (family GH31 glycosyl hydrolase)